MKKMLTLLTGLLAFSAVLPAQSPVAEPFDSTRFDVVDSVIYVPTARVDTSLVGVDVFSILPDGLDGTGAVRIYQSEAVAQAMRVRAASNKDRSFEGYRVRIFFKESARAESEEVVRAFRTKYPGVPAYRSYANPYFKVTVGDFRTKSEAMQLMEKVISEYPAAFVVKEAIQYPAVDKTNAYVRDTVRVFKAKELPTEEQ